MIPQERLMLGSIHVGGDEFEREQQHKDVRASSSSSWPEEDAPRRSYRLAEDYGRRRAEDYLAAVNRDRHDMEIRNGIPERLRTQRMPTSTSPLSWSKGKTLPCQCASMEAIRSPSVVGLRLSTERSRV